MNSWKEKRFTDCILLNPSIKTEKDLEYSFIEMADLGPENKYATPKRYRKPNGLTKFQEGDTLFAKITPCLENGNICQAAKLDNGIGVGSTEFFVFRGKDGVIHNEFVYYLLRSYPIKEYAIRNMTGSAGQQRVPTDIFKSLVIPLPEYEESKRIGQFLSLFDRKIYLLRRQNEILEEMAQALFRHWFIDFEFPISKEYAESIGKSELEGMPYRSIGGEMVESDKEKMLPLNWRIGTLSEEFEIKMGQSPPGASYNENGDGIEFFQGRAEFTDRYPTVRLYTIEPKRYADKFDTLLSVRAPVGDINMAYDKCCIGRGLASISSSSHKSYCFHKIKSLKSSFDIFESEGTVFGSIGKTDLNGLEVIVPDKNTIDKYETYVATIDRRYFFNYKTINVLTRMRDTLLPKLMSGEVRV